MSTTTELQSIAGRIRELRTIMGLTPAQMAEITGVSQREYIESENGYRDMSFTFLHKCATAFKTDLSALVTGEMPKLSKYTLLRNGEGMPIRRKEGFEYQHMAPLFKDRLIDPFLVTAKYSEKLENAKLELASGKNEIDRLANDINNLTAQRSQAKTESEQLDLTAQIQTAQTQKERAELELKKKQAEIETLNNNLNNSVVTANISGIVNHVGAVGSQSVQEGGNSGNEGVDSSGAFITLLMSGTFRVKGTVDEMNVGSLSEGMNVTVHSRMDDTKTWTGSIAKIETNSPSSGNENQAGGGQAAEGATKYYFYVNLASSDGLLLGQHVYIEPGIQWDTEDSTDSSASVPGTTAVAAN